ncbi:hypothetical protein FRC01_010721 [Tulasnella sp. 417]|nr:hypothetical protein FRC01_010721 [Tulasnella sp. 417]
MKLPTLSIASLSFIPSLIAAIAIPDVASRNETLAKRGGEVNYLANCQRIDPKDSYTASYVAWYANIDNTQSGNDTHIDSGAQGQAFQAYAGWAGRTSDGKRFNCYKVRIRKLGLAGG